MNAAGKQRHLNAAEVFDSWRVVPRAALLGFCALTGWATIYVIWWYCHLAAPERTTQVTAFMSMMFTTLMGASGFIFKVYSDNGRDWTQTRPADPIIVPAPAAT